MSVDLIYGQFPPPGFDVDRPSEAVRVGNVSSEVVGGKPIESSQADLPAPSRPCCCRSHAATQRRSSHSGTTWPVSCVSTSVARRDLRAAPRSEAVAQRTLAEVLEDAIHFDPHRGSAQAWLLTRAPQRAMEELRSVDGTDNALTAMSSSPRQRYSRDTRPDVRTPSLVPVVATGGAIVADEQGAPVGHHRLDHPHRCPALRLRRLRLQQTAQVTTSALSVMTGSNSHG